MRIWICGAVALLCAVGLSGTAAAAKKPKPFHETATTCAKYVSPAWVQKETGVVGAPQKGPAGQCHFIVNGVRDAFQVGIHNMGTQKKALALLQQAWKGLASDSSSTGTWVTGLGTKAFVLDGPLNGAYVVRGDEFFDLQWFAPIALTHDQSTAVLKALLAKVPK